MAKKKTRRVSKKKIFMFIVLPLLIIGGACYYVFFGQDKTDKVVKPKSSDTIKGYDYTLRSDATKYYKKLFKELKSTLEADEVDSDAYAELVAKMFVCDFYNLDNKVGKNDVGGVQFVYKDYRDDFTKKATNSMYKSVESNVYGKRSQKLPIVSNVSVAKNDGEPFTYGDKTDAEAYNISFEITYKENLGYQNKGTLTLIHNDKKIEVASLEE